MSNYIKSNLFTVEIEDVFYPVNGNCQNIYNRCQNTKLLNFTAVLRQG